MIHKLIQNHHLNNRNNLLKGFSTSSIGHNTMSEEDFNKKYSAGYNVFNTESIANFTKDALEKGMTQEEISSEVSKLEKVLISKGTKTFSLFVSPIEGEEEGK